MSISTQLGGCMNPRLRVLALKLDRLGNTVSKFESLTPNQDPSVAPNWSTEVVGMKRPRPTSMGPGVFKLGGSTGAVP